MVPFFPGRIDMLAKVAAGKGKKIAVERPSESFKKPYYDAAFFDADALELLAKFAEDHVVYASDYPLGQNLGRSCYEASTAMMDKAKLDPESKESTSSGKRLFLRVRLMNSDLKQWQAWLRPRSKAHSSF